MVLSVQEEKKNGEFLEIRLLKFILLTSNNGTLVQLPWFLTWLFFLTTVVFLFGVTFWVVIKLVTGLTGLAGHKKKKKIYRAWVKEIFIVNDSITIQ